MPAPSAAPASPPGHQFALNFDRVCCRNCGADVEDAGMKCPGAKRIRPIAGIRQQQQTEGRA